MSLGKAVTYTQLHCCYRDPSFQQCVEGTHTQKLNGVPKATQVMKSQNSTANLFPVSVSFSGRLLFSCNPCPLPEYSFSLTVASVKWVRLFVCGTLVMWEIIVCHSVNLLKLFGEHCIP